MSEQAALSRPIAADGRSDRRCSRPVDGHPGAAGGGRAFAINDTHRNALAPFAICAQGAVIRP